jgi:hypothetical protein
MMSVDALASSRQRLTVLYGADEVSGYMTGEGMLDVLTITNNGQTVTAYPVFKAGSPLSARITRITECENALEGQIEVFASGGTLNFFDTMYFRRKHSYSPGKDTKVLLGIATSSPAAGPGRTTTTRSSATRAVTSTTTSSEASTRIS